MYRSIVRRRVKFLFGQANQGNWRAIIDDFGNPFVHRFVGDTPLGGTRTTRASMIAWFERVYRLIPDAQFDPQAVVVEGPPWNTRIMTYVKLRGSFPDGPTRRTAPYENEIMQLMTLRWGRIVSVTTLEDTLRFAEVLSALAVAGNADATAAPISDLAAQR